MALGQFLACNTPVTSPLCPHHLPSFTLRVSSRAYRCPALPTQSASLPYPQGVFPGVHHASFCLLSSGRTSVNMYTFIGDGAQKPPQINVTVAQVRGLQRGRLRQGQINERSVSNRGLQFEFGN